MKRLIYIIILLIVGINCSLSSQVSPDHNYIITRTPLDGVADVDNPGNARVLTTIQYYDGLGRPSQSVQKGITPSGADLVNLTEYDGLGREYREWLPAPVEGNNGAYMPGIVATATDYYDDDKPYTETTLEQSPLNRTLGVKSPGATFHDHPTAVEYMTNEANEVKLLSAYNTAGIQCKGYYAAATLYKTKHTDEDGKVSYEYKDKLGQTVLIRRVSDGMNHDTYYVYDDFGNTVCVLPPLLSDYVGGTATYTFTHQKMREYAYCYKYDHRNRCTHKRLPGCDWVYMVYDKADRLILTQDGNQRAKPDKEGRTKWTLFKYDRLGRELYTSELTVSGTCESMNSYFNDYVVTETFMDENAEMYPVEDTGYSKGWYHVAPMRLLTVKYYDNYDFLSFSSGYLNYEQRDGYGEPYDNATGLLTGTRTYLLDGSGEYLSAAYYYDSRGRLVQERSTNHMKGYDAVYYQYDFAGNVLQSFKQHYTYDFKMILIEEHYTHTYDHAGRLIETRYQLNDNAETVLVQNEYDELGRLKRKTQHNGSNRVDYEYNIRNWLAKIKDGNLEESLFYCSENRFILMIGATNCYNGNIAQISINHHGTNHTYIYHYDGLNRLVEAKKNPPLQLAPVGGESAYANSDKFSYNETFSYDKHGNITNLLRYAKSREVILPTIQGNPEKTTYMPTIIDNLELEYEGNRIVGINDAVTADALYNRKEYHDLNTSGNDFAYDANGNMLYDLDRDIVTIRYNLLNLPDTVQFRDGSRMVHQYAADGQKLKTEYATPSLPLTVPLGKIPELLEIGFINKHGTLYNGNLEYTFDERDTVLQRIHHEAGYMDRSDPESDLIRCNYYRRDHLGNVREVWKATDSGAQTVQRTRYYPSGLPWEYQAGDSASLQPYKYGGKEFVEMHGLDMYDSHARWYDPLTFRTPTPDPLAEKYYSISPYAWCGNNPVNNVDPTGMDYWSTSDPDEIKRMLAALKDAYEGGSNKPFEDFSYSGWNHATDAEFLSGLTYDDEKQLFYSSFSTIENNEFVKVGFSVPAMGDYAGSASVKTKQGEWWDKASGRLELDNSLFDVITIGRGILNPFVTTPTRNVGAKSLGAAAKGFSKEVPHKGFKEVREFGRSHGQKIYKYRGKYYSRDVGSGNGLGSHNGGVWKVFELKNGKLKRIGTADENLNIFKY